MFLLFSRSPWDAADQASKLYQRESADQLQKAISLPLPSIMRLRDRGLNDAGRMFLDP